MTPPVHVDDRRDRRIAESAADDAPLMDHAYDGIQEYDNPLPGWWRAIFWAIDRVRRRLLASGSTSRAGALDARRALSRRRSPIYDEQARRCATRAKPRTSSEDSLARRRDEPEDASRTARRSSRRAARAATPRTVTA